MAGMIPQLEVLKIVGIETVLEVDITNDYQGDVLAVVRKESWSDRLCAREKIGFVAIGYGSCGGCDEWVDADPEDRLSFTLGHLRGIKWFPNLAELQAFVAGAPAGVDESYNSDHALQWYGHARYFHEFQEMVAALADGLNVREDQS